MNKVLIIFALAAVHFALSLAFFLLSFAGSMSRFDAASESSIFARIVDALAYVLLFPVVQLAVRSGGGWMTGLTGYVPFVVNSLLWAIVLYFIINFFAHRQTTTTAAAGR